MSLISANDALFYCMPAAGFVTSFVADLNFSNEIIKGVYRNDSYEKNCFYFSYINVNGKNFETIKMIKAKNELKAYRFISLIATVALIAKILAFFQLPIQNQKYLIIATIFYSCYLFYQFNENKLAVGKLDSANSNKITIY